MSSNVFADMRNLFGSHIERITTRNHDVFNLRIVPQVLEGLVPSLHVGPVRVFFDRFGRATDDATASAVGSSTRDMLSAAETASCQDSDASASDTGASTSSLRESSR